MIQFHDISYAQGDYNMDADPNPVIFMKASGFYYGSKIGYYDTGCTKNYTNAKRLGKIPGLYHFAGGADPVAEADFFIGACSPLETNDVLILDYELTAEMNPPADPNAWCLAFVERVKERTGKYPLFYTYFAMLEQYGFTEVLKRCGLWIAHYGVSPDQDIPNCPPYICHQFQGSPIDTNALFISLDTLKKYGYQGGTDVSTPEPAPEAPQTDNPGTPTPEAPAPEPAPVPAETNTQSPPTPPPSSTPAPEAPKPPKVVVPEPHLYFTFWQLLIALLKRLLGVK